MPINEEPNDTDDTTETPKVPPAEEEEDDEDDKLLPLPTEYAVGSDGRLYVTEDGFKRGGTAGRKQWIGYQLTDEEAAKVWDGIHRQAFNATLPLRARR